MRYIKLTLLIAFIFFSFEKSSAQGIYGNIESFTIDYTHLSNGQNILKLNKVTTPIKYKVSLTRSTDPNGGQWAYYPVDIIIGLGYLKDGKYLFFGGSYNFKSTDFGQYQSNLEKQLTAQIDPSVLAASDKIYLVYEYHRPNFPSSSWRAEKFPVNSSGYGFELPVTIFYNVAKSASFVKNDCPAGSEPPLYTSLNYSVPAKKYSSIISQADADAKAQGEINANGQNKANVEGLCKDFGNVKKPNGWNMIFYNDYIEDIKWKTSIFNSGNGSVKIELFESETLIRIISSNTPNNGLLKNVLISTNTDPLPFLDAKIKITSLETGETYFSTKFSVFQD